ncbi:hypothetical protein [Lignipirellula cremea]|uniref:Uncharacterized protein n=1 Tax=Lignipirellula cremea TaxID=2528010 RepID=A0A518DZ60_9BACT|nr:hypothetical protein [Lignipirellula cremea]QDU97130.1 hypothetical protein Pla8534_49750 [Lignipirellula cremea]
MVEPFIEHPGGEFDTAVDAMADAIRRLRELPQGSNWITFCAQGMGSRVDSYHFAEIAWRDDNLRLDQPLDADEIAQQAGVPPSSFSKQGDMYSIHQATPREAAQVLDTIFRHHMGIRPHTGEGNDYAVGAEWESSEPPATAKSSPPPRRPWWRFW